MVDSLQMLARNRWFNWAWRFAVTLIVAGWILARLELAEFTRVLIAPRWDALIAMVIVSLIFATLGGIKVWVLLRALAPVKLRVIVGYFLVATSFGAFTPASLGDFSIAAFLRHENVPAHQGLSVMLVDRVISISVYVLVFTPLTIGLLIHADQLWWFSLIFLVGAVIGLILNANKTVRRFVLTRLVRVYVPTIEDLARTFSDLWRFYPWHLFGNLGVTLARSVIAGLVVQLALLAAHEQSLFFAVVCATNFLTIVNLFPISLGGVGVYEGSGVILFEQIGFKGENVLAALLYQRAYIVLSSVLIILTSWLYTIWRTRRSATRLM